MGAVILILWLSLGFSLSAAVSVERSIRQEDYPADDYLQVSLAIIVTPPDPQLLMVSEKFPVGVRLCSASWQGQSIAGKASADFYQWLLGWPTPLESGLLQYRLEMLPEAESELLWEGKITLPDGSEANIAGQSRLARPTEILPAPQFSPADGSVFTDNLLLELHCPDGFGEIFFAFGDDPPIADWLWYEGPFYIDSSAIVQAEIWNARGEFSPRSTACYYRREERRLDLQPGWNWLGNALLLTTTEQQKLLREYGPAWSFCPQNRCWQRATSLEPGQAYFIYCARNKELFLRGLMPLPQDTSALLLGWQPRLLDDEWITGPQTWLWLNDRYRKTGKNHPQAEQAAWSFYPK